MIKTLVALATVTTVTLVPSVAAATETTAPPTSATATSVTSMPEDDSLSPLPGSLTVPDPEFYETPDVAPEIADAVSITAPQLAATGPGHLVLLAGTGLAFVLLGALCIGTSRSVTSTRKATS